MLLIMEWRYLKVIVDIHLVKFIISVAKSLEKKPVADVSAKQHVVTENPFLPCEPDLFVCTVMDTHNLVLNKFNVVDHHLILATKDFEPQSEGLKLKDMTALYV